MAAGKFSFFNEDSKWFRSTSIATYLILASTVLCLISTGLMAYYAIYPDKVSGESSFEGKVKDEVTDRPIAGVSIIVEETGEFTVTDKEGEYHLNDTEAGVQTLVFSKPGYQTQKVDYFLDETSKSAPWDLGKLRLKPIADHTENTVLEEGSVAGSVTLNFQGVNHPFEGAEVSISGSSIDYNDTESTIIRDEIDTVTTKADGTYSISGLHVGTLELIMVLEFNASHTQNTNYKFYKEIVTFYASPGTEINIDIEIDIPGTNANLEYPYTHENIRSIVSNHDLDLTFATPSQVAEKDLEVTLTKHHTGEVVATKTIGNRNLTFTDVPQGVYDVTVFCEDCSITHFLNVSVSDDTQTVITVPFGEEPDEKDKTDTSGLWYCVIPNILFSALGFVGAFFAFTRKKFFLAVLGGIACIIQQSPIVAIPSLSCISVNMILGVLAAVLIFRSRQLFDDAPKTDESMLENGGQCPVGQKVEKDDVPPAFGPDLKKSGKGKKKGKK